MAFVVEDGTVVANANSFVTLAYADAYFLDRAITAWTGVQAVKESALIRATDYVNNRFNFLGTKYDEDQTLEFPRVYADSEDAEMPDKLLKATCEYALRALTATLAPDPVTDTTGLQVQSKMTKVGPIEKEVVYKEGGTIYTFKPYPAADMLLKGLIDNTRRVIR